MKRSFFTLMMWVFAFVLLAIPVMAQDDAPPGPGEGAPVVEGNFGGDIATTNVILVNDGSSEDVTDMLFPTFIDVDPDSGFPAPGVANSLATDWTFSDDGKVMTITIRDDRMWSDGTPITSEDIKYAYEAVSSGVVDTPLASALGSIESIETPDATTVVITFTEANNCNAVVDAANIPVVPAHHYREVYPTFEDMTTENPANLDPQVSSGPFKFSNFRPGEQVTLLASENYPDTEFGYTVPQGWVYKTLADQLVWTEQFLAGDITWLQVPEDRVAEFEERAAAGEFTMHLTPSTGWMVLLFNQADAANPQPGLDEDGNVVEQAPHPIFGDLRVRQAVTHAIDHAALNEGAFSGTGAEVGGPMLPASWAYNENISPYAFDPELAMQLLDEAGFVDDDNNADTPRVATEDALYAEAGTPLEFNLTSFTGNLSVDASTVLMQDQLRRVGFQVNLDIIEFTPMLDKLVGQTYDALLVFWGVTEVNPNEMYDQLSREADVPGAGFNTGSFSNEEFDSIMQEARNLPGCDLAERKALYDRAQEIIHTEVPYYLVNTTIIRLAISNTVENFNPRPKDWDYNKPAWVIR